MAVEQSAAFQTAVADSRKLTGKPSNDQLLELYALYKVGTGEDFAKSPEPGMFDLKGKAKRNAWKKHADEGLTPEKAQEQYVALVESLKESVGYDANKVPETVGSS